MAYFFSPKALLSQRSSGFRSTSNAIAEIVDNAFDADASHVKIIFIERRLQHSQRSNFSVDEILICDNGKGMNLKTLSECLTFGSSGDYSEEDLVTQKRLGKFGYGLPNSSLSQCPNTTVYSWQSENQVRSTNLNLEEILDKDSIEIPAPVETPFPKYFKEIGAGVDFQTGTIIQWKDCDRLKPKQAKTLVDHSERMLGRIFRYMISRGQKIEFLNFQENPDSGTYSSLLPSRLAVANDPLYLTPKCTLARILYNSPQTDTLPIVKEKLAAFSKSKIECLPTNNLIKEHSFSKEFEWDGKVYKYSVKTSFAHIDIQKPGIMKGGETSVGREYGRKLDTGSISFVRSDREIASGRFGLYKAGSPTDRWWTIEVQFYPDLDDLLGVANNKQYIEFEKTTKDASLEEYNPYTAKLNDARDELWSKLSKSLGAIITDMRKQIRANDKQFKEANLGPGSDGGELPGATPTTQDAIHVTDGKGSQLTLDEKMELSEILADKYPKLDVTAINAGIEKFDQLQSKGVLLYAASDADKLLWTFTRVHDFIIILVNTSHKFYENVMEPLKDASDESALAALELFISSLAWSETDYWDDDKKKDTIEDFREAAGMHLSRYIRDNNIKIEAGALVVGNPDEFEDL